ncbi:MAG: PGF-pre-PGF domain-containing protein [Methanocorpusculum sp.]|nr:PGF-pre-PGF domain-containing protein [Methanocorpusculum sp.]
MPPPLCNSLNKRSFVKFGLITLAVLLMFSLAVAPAATALTISDEAGLNGFRDQVNSGSYDGTVELGCDITLEGDWIPIGIDNDHCFTGTFDGKGHTIRGLSISASESDYCGLFGKTTNANIKNLNVEVTGITGSSSVGGLVGHFAVANGGSGIITNCSVTGGTVTGKENVGGLVGWARCIGTGSLTIENCYAACAVRATGTGYSSNVGGLVAYANVEGSGSISITKCYTTGTVTGDTFDKAWYVGGLIAHTNVVSGGSISITNCYTTGAVSGLSTDRGYVGGIMGTTANPGISITNCYATGAVEGSGSNNILVGGLVGWGESLIIQNSVALNPSVKGTGSNVGRVAGMKSNTATLVNNYAWDGMIVDRNGQTITNSVADGRNGTSVSSTEVWANLTSYQAVLGSANISINGDTVWNIVSPDDGVSYPLPYLRTLGKDDSLRAQVLYLKPAESYNLWVNNEQFTSSHLTITCGGGNAVFNPTTSTLTLNNADITQGCEVDYLYSGIVSFMDDLEIILHGVNTVTNTGGEGISTYQTDPVTFAPIRHNLTLSGDGKLTIKENTTSYGYGIYSTGNLTLDGVDIDILSEASGLWTQQDMRLKDSTIDIEVNKTGYYGLVTNTGTIYLDNTTLNASSYGGGQYGSPSKVIILGNNVDAGHYVQNSGKVTLNGENGIGGYVDSDITINGGTLEITVNLQAITEIPTTNIYIAPGLEEEGARTGTHYLVRPAINYAVSAKISNATTELTGTTVETSYKEVYSVGASGFLNKTHQPIHLDTSDYTWAVNSSVITVDKNAATGNATLTMNGVGTVNLTLNVSQSGGSAHDKAIAYVIFNISKAQSNAGTPTAEPVLYTGQELSAIPITADVQTPGTWGWDVPATAVSRGIASYPANFTPVDTANYTTVNQNIEVTAIPMTVTCDRTNTTGADFTAVLNDTAIDAWTYNLSITNVGDYAFSGNFGIVKANVSGLTPGHTYTAKIYAVNSSQEVWNKTDLSFTTVTAQLISGDIYNGSTLITDTEISGISYLGTYNLGAGNFKDQDGQPYHPLRSEYIWIASNSNATVVKLADGNATVTAACAGTVNVSLVKAGNTILANVTFVISKAVPQESDFILTPASAVYTGANLTTVVSAKYSGMGDITNVTYNGEQNVSAVGEYIVRVNVTGGDNYTSATQVNAGSFTITQPVNPPSPSRSGGGQDTGSGNYKEYDRSVTNGGTVSFGSSPTVTSVDLPAGVSGSVALIAESDTPAPSGKQTVKIFEINIPTYSAGEPATIQFKLTVAEIEKAGYTPADICLYHCDAKGVWSKLPTTFTVKDGVVYYEAVTTEFSPFAIVYEKGAAKADETIVIPTATAEPVVTVTSPAQTATTAAQPTATATASPLCTAGLIAGLGCVLLAIRRK